MPNETAGKKPRKVPYYVSGPARKGDQGSAEDRAALTSFDRALAVRGAKNYDGVGLAMLRENGLVALDFDDVVAADGTVRPDVLALVEGTYAELSPSKTGIRAFFRGEILDRKCHNKDKRWPFAVEFFHAAGYVTVTGDVLPECSMFGFDEIVAPLPDAVRALYEQRFGATGTTSPTPPDLGDWFDSCAGLLSEVKIGLDIDRARRLFAGIDIKACGYEDWLQDGQALHHEFDGALDAFEVWNDWSSQEGADYPGRETLEAKWASFGRYSGHPITAARLLKRSANRTSSIAYEELQDRTDAGNANLLRTLTDRNLRFVVERKAWMWWDGARWTVDESGAIAQARALDVGKHYLDKANDVARRCADQGLDEPERKKLTKVADSLRAWGTQCRNRRALDSMLVVASRDPRVGMPADALDRDPWLFGVANGVVDLRTGELRAAAREDLVTKGSRVPYRPDATAPRFRAFVDEISALAIAAETNPRDGTIKTETVGRYERRPSLSAYLHRAMGYAITGKTDEHKLFIAVGPGANGKSILLDILQWVIGDYWRTIPPEALMATRHDADAERPSPTAASLAGARAAISSESRDGQRLDVALVKRHTGGGYMTARLMRENSFRFEITHKLVLMTNHRPALDHLDDAVRGRLHLIPFDRVWNRPGHPERDPALPDGDKNLMGSLRDEAEGILVWLVEGAIAYHRDGLDPPPEVVRMTRDYFASQDSLGQWLAACERCEPQAGQRTTELLGEFKGWCAAEGIRPSVQSARALSMALNDRGIAKKETATGTHFGLQTPCLF